MHLVFSALPKIKVSPRRKPGPMDGAAISNATEGRAQPTPVMTRFMRVIHVFLCWKAAKTWMVRTSRAMTTTNKDIQTWPHMTLGRKHNG